MSESLHTVELFCGTKSFSKVAEKLGYKTFTVDIEPRFNPDLCKDILKLELSDLPPHIDVLWASPPCTTFSVASLRHYWVDGKPKNEKTLHGIAIVKKTLSIIKELLQRNPEMLFYIENPRGMLRKQDFMQEFKRNTVTYCQYGDDRMKPTDVWTNDLNWKPRAMCRNGDPCHASARRGSNTGTQGRGGGGRFGWVMRGVIPENLFYEILRGVRR